MSLTFIFKVKRVEFRCFECSFQTSGTRTIRFGIYANVDEVSSVSKSKSINLSMKSRKCRKLRGGRLIKVVPSKVPRIIGRSGSMVELIKNSTGTQIVVGQNGLVWVKGENEDLATEAILLIDEKAHIKGLTDFIKDFLEKSPKRTRPMEQQPEKESFDDDVDDDFDSNESSEQG